MRRAFARACAFENGGGLPRLSHDASCSVDAFNRSARATREKPPLLSAHVRTRGFTNARSLSAAAKVSRDSHAELEVGPRPMERNLSGTIASILTPKAIFYDPPEIQS